MNDVNAPYGAKDARQDVAVAGSALPGSGAVEPVVSALFERGFGLGGSRRMAQKFPDKVVIGPHTDWDFYGEACGQSRATVTALGFELLECPNQNYWDNLLVEMYQHPTLPIQVLLRREVEIYKAAFESIDADTFVRDLWKSSPVRNDWMNDNTFKAMVCAHFNNLFAAHGYAPSPAFDDSPF